MPIVNQPDPMPIRDPIEGAFQPVRPPGFALLRGFTSLGILILLGGCEMGPSMFIGARDREIRDSTQAVQSAHDNVELAKAYSTRGVAYSEKARYSREFKLIAADEYERIDTELMEGLRKDSGRND